MIVNCCSQKILFCLHLCKDSDDWFKPFISRGIRVSSASRVTVEFIRHAFY